MKNILQMNFTAKLTENLKNIYILETVKLSQSTNKIEFMIYLGLKINIFEDELLFGDQKAFLNVYIWIRNTVLFSMLSHHQCRWECRKRYF